MLAQTENAIIDKLKSSPIANLVRGIKPMPEIPMAELINKIGADAPAIFVDMGNFAVDGGNNAHLTAELLLLVKSNANDFGKHSRGRDLGLYDFMDMVMAQMHNSKIMIVAPDDKNRTISIRVMKGSFIRNAGFEALKIVAATVSLQCIVELDSAIDDSKLSNFALGEIT